MLNTNNSTVGVPFPSMTETYWCDIVNVVKVINLENELNDIFFMLCVMTLV